MKKISKYNTVIQRNSKNKMCQIKGKIKKFNEDITIEVVFYSFYIPLVNAYVTNGRKQNYYNDKIIL